MKYYIGYEKVSWAAVKSHAPDRFHQVYDVCWRIDGSDRYLNSSSNHAGEYTQLSYMSKWKPYTCPDDHYLNIKHVPKRIKEADYRSESEWFSAVWKFIVDFRNKAKAKAKMKTDQSRLSADIEFCGMSSTLDTLAQQKGFQPTPLCAWQRERTGLNTVNELAAKDGYLRLEYRKDRKRQVKAWHNKSRGCIMEVSGIPDDKLELIISTIMGVL